jgi:nitrite reductase/ring-hydroxylating ferredoxin subunit
MVDNPQLTLCQLNDIPDSGSKEFDIDGQSLFAVRKDGEVFVYINSCPHTGLPLNWRPDQFMDYDKNYIQCAIHAAIFDPKTGLCVAGPCQGDHLDNIPCKVDANNITITVPVVFRD